MFRLQRGPGEGSTFDLKANLGRAPRATPKRALGRKSAKQTNKKTKKQREETSQFPLGPPLPGGPDAGRPAAGPPPARLQLDAPLVAPHLETGSGAAAAASNRKAAWKKSSTNIGKKQQEKITQRSAKERANVWLCRAGVQFRVLFRIRIRVLFLFEFEFGFEFEFENLRKPPQSSLRSGTLRLSRPPPSPTRTPRGRENVSHVNGSCMSTAPYGASLCEVVGVLHTTKGKTIIRFSAGLLSGSPGPRSSLGPAIFDVLQETKVLTERDSLSFKGVREFRADRKFLSFESDSGLLALDTRKRSGVIFRSSPTGLRFGLRD